MEHSIPQKIACMKTMATESGLNRLENMMALTKDKELPIRTYQGYFDAFLIYEEQMTSKMSDKYVKALKELYEAFKNKFDDFERKATKNGRDYVPFWV